MTHLTQSTSPQVLMYASIDAARQQMAVHGAELWRRAIELADWARERIVACPACAASGRSCSGEAGWPSSTPRASPCPPAGWV